MGNRAVIQANEAKFNNDQDNLDVLCDFYNLFNHPEKDWESILEAASELPHQPSLFY